jgi:dinuclear metal center YbgI/SA1388 family protein
LNKEAVNVAIEQNVNLIITHHPFIFTPIKSINYSTYDGQITRDLIKNNINLYSMHTSFDMAEYGVNFDLSQRLGADSYDILHPVNIDRSGYGGIANIDPINLVEFSKLVKESLNCKKIKLYCNDENEVISRIAFCGGSGSEFISDAICREANVYITGDIKYHEAQNALKNNLSIIDAGHYYTEYGSLRNMRMVLDSIEGIETLLLEKNTVNEIII